MNSLNTVLVTGASGFIGKHLCRALSQAGYTVLECNSQNGSITNGTYFAKYMQQPIDHIFHLAASTFVPNSWQQPAAFIESNVLGTLNTLEFAVNKNATVTFVSAYIYGNAGSFPISESTPVNPNNPYALSKKMAEDVCIFYRHNYRIPVTIVRPFNIYGPGQSAHFLIPTLIEQLKKGPEVTVKALAPRRDFLFIDDLVRLLLCTIRYRVPGIFNAGSGRSFSVLEVLQALEDMMGKKINIICHEENRTNEIPDTIADISKAKKVFHWEPVVDLRSGLKSMFP